MPVNNSEELRDKAAIVTGGGHGIGKACALALAQEGASVSVLDLDLAAAEAVAKRICETGGQAFATHVDVSDPAAVNRAFEAHVAQLDRIDVVVNCAGICWKKRVVELEDDEWKQMLSINLDGTFYVARAAARVMERQKAGTIILISSGQGITGEAGFGAYAASKGGVARLGEVLAEELGPNGITVNVVNPGLTFTRLSRDTFKTEQDWRAIAARSTLPRLGRPADVAHLVVFLAGPGSTFMSGQHITTRGRSPGQLSGPHDWVFDEARALGAELPEGM